MGNPRRTSRACASCAPLQTLMQTGSDSISASTIARNAGMTRSNESGKLIPSRRGHESHVAACGSHSAGMRYPRAAGRCDGFSTGANLQRPTVNVQLRNRYCGFWGAQAASLQLPAACRQHFRGSESGIARSVSAGCRDEQAGSLCSPVERGHRTDGSSLVTVDVDSAAKMLSQLQVCKSRQRLRP
jgi:hypothetical protein